MSRWSGRQRVITPEQIILRLLIATILGAAVGLERERLEWVAGLRTHALVCVGSALFMIVSAFGFADALGSSNVVLDPSRVAAQVVSGIGFIGAGTIILRREIVRGLTTAASIWAVAAIGLAVGGGMYIAAIAATVFALVILVVVKPIEWRIFRHRRARRVSLKVDPQETSLSEIKAKIEAANLRLDHLVIRSSNSLDEEQVELYLARGVSEEDLLLLVEGLSRFDGVHEIRSLVNEVGSTP
jgi:putative Mg2+ transporter-C (MgtC) family protein